MRYQRVFIAGGTYFFTLVTDHRQKIFSDEITISLLRGAFSMVINKYPFTIDAIVILPDHIHTIWTMPEGITDYPLRWRLIKSAFTRSLKTKPIVTSASRLLKGEQAVWQRRYWEHQIRDQEDFNHHMDYIHFNPVKHGLVSSPREWKYSSFLRCVKEGLDPENWETDQIFLPDHVDWE